MLTTVAPTDPLSSAEFEELMMRSGSHCVSLYLPTHRAGRDIRQDPIRLKNLARAAEESLRSRGVRGSELPQILQPIRKLATDGIFWHYQNRGLAVFLAPEWNRFYRLPLTFEELAVVGDRFHLKPVLPLFANDNSFCVLALSQKQVRLLHCRNHLTEEIDLEEIVPRSREEALRWEDRAPHSQNESTGSRRPGFPRRGSDHNAENTELERFCQLLDKGLPAVLPNHATPLVLSGIDPLVSLFREISGYPHLEPSIISGNPDRLDPDELHTRGWGIVRGRFDRLTQERRERFEELANKRSPLAVLRLETAVPASVGGRVEVLFVPSDGQRWGVFDPEKQTVTVHARRQVGDEDLFDLAAIQTFAHGGTVHAVEPAEIPGPGPVAAILRY